MSGDAGRIGASRIEPADVRAVVTVFVGEYGTVPPGGVPQEALLSDLDVDSLGLVDLLTLLEREFGVEVPDERIAGISSVADLIDEVVAVSLPGGAHGPGRGDDERSPLS
ncbi:phosphopantetheine-binding protein [Frankia sp. KB5]|uniref:phosphopantetheine-binding protein n=1 Tax=Frankia sp. KB5 TaxID=683318 RepID=UPI000A252D2E|nr:phosphopantetheine-binding protein [Frankia sp. KB5]ORT53520.1 hypothetical protein KBI5_06860 [Frankia sp. KB5]